MARPIAIAVANRIALMPTTPASRTKILNGAGGGSSDGTRTAMMPWRCSDAIARSILSPVKRFLTSASPPFRPIACITRQPATDCGDDIPRDEFLVSRSHHDQQQIGDAGQRKERRIEERDEEQPRRTERQRERADAADDSPHRMRS